MAQKKRPFSSFLDNPETNKAVQEALHAPSQLPAQEIVPEPGPAPVAQAPVAAIAPEPVKSDSGKKEEDGFAPLTIRRSVHRFLKMASVQYSIEIRELATEAIANDPRVKQMIDMMEKNNS